MAKLTKAQTREHLYAQDMLNGGNIKTHDDVEYILQHFNPAADHNVTYSGTYFTPPSLASDFRLEIHGKNVLDVCAGIGSLSFYASLWPYNNQPKPNVTAIEINPQFVEIGKRLMPHINWICGNVFDLPKLVKDHDLPFFDCVYGNPPFGRVPRAPDEGKTTNHKTPYHGPRYSGPEFEYHLIDLVADYAKQGAFVLPQMSSPFTYSGDQHYRDDRQTRACKSFSRKTGLNGEFGAGIDTAIFKEYWNNITPPPLEIVCFDFDEWRNARKPQPVAIPQSNLSTLTLDIKQPDLFSA